jgi:hypothetical protein
MKASYDLNKIKFATAQATLQKAFDLYGKGKVTEFSEEPGSFTAIVLGSQAYNVSVSARHYDEGFCSCYLGQNDTLCKHLVALAICAVKQTRPLTKEERQVTNEPISSDRLGTLTQTEVADFKKSAAAIVQKYIKTYESPSRIWFRYQNSLDEGSHRLSALVSELPVGKQTAALLVTLLLRLDTKLSTGGIDDSNGTIGNFMQGIVEVLVAYYILDEECGRAFLTLRNRKTCFGWEERLLKTIKQPRN